MSKKRVGFSTMKKTVFFVIIAVGLLGFLRDERVPAQTTSTGGYPKTNKWGWPNAYAPQSSNAPTVGKGVDLTEHLRSLGFSQEVIDSMSKDINGVPRPRGRWDIGAYQFPIQSYPAGPSNLRVNGN